MAKALIISDIHLHRWSYGSILTKDGFNSRLADQLNYLMTVRNIACENGVKHVICLGDLFHTHSTVHAEVLHCAAFFVQSLYDANIKFHCIVGNHDMSSKDGRIHTLDWLRPYGNVIDEWSIFDIEDRRVVAAPYMESEEKLRDVFNLPVDSELFLLHQGINLNDNAGSAWVINEIFTPDMVPESAKCVLTGHYHKPVDDGKIHIVGSPMQHTWADCDDVPRGVILLDLNTLEIQRIENNYSPRFLKMKYGELEAKAHNRFVRMYDCPKSKMEEQRQILLNCNAKSVEFEVRDTQEKVDAPPIFTSLDQVVKAYDEVVDGRRREVGQSLRDRTYETP